MKLQAWWRGVLVVRSAAEARWTGAELSRIVRRAAYASCAAALGNPLPPPSSPLPDDDELVLQEAILIAKGEKAAAGASCLPIMLGVDRALKCIQGADGKAPSCPGGHPLITAYTEPGSQCDCCGWMAARAGVAVECDDPSCSLIACARRPTCVPLSIIRVSRALRLRCVVVDLSFAGDPGGSEVEPHLSERLAHSTRLARLG